MKTYTLLILMISTSMAWSQTPPMDPKGPPGGGQRPPGGDLMGKAFFPPELVMRNQKAINLSPDQQNSIRSEMQKTMPRFTELQWQLSGEEEALNTILQSEKPDEKAVIAQFEKLLAVETEMKRLQLAMMLRIKNLLTQDQQNQLRELKRSDRQNNPGRQPPQRDEER
jgi:Spy/CpxP family protein refolding chaperone